MLFPAIFLTPNLRQHVRSALPSLHSTGAATLNASDLRALKAINRPVRRADKKVPVKMRWQRGRKLAGAFEVSPHDWDTVHYWYEHMLESFAGDGSYLKAGAL